MEQANRADFSLVSSAIALLTLVLLSVGVLSTLGYLFSFSQERPVNSAFDHSTLEIKSLIPDRL